jgi:hypothetical protein
MISSKPGLSAVTTPSVRASSGPYDAAGFGKTAGAIRALGYARRNELFGDLAEKMTR